MTDRLTIKVGSPKVALSIDDLEDMDLLDFYELVEEMKVKFPQEEGVNYNLEFYYGHDGDKFLEVQKYRLETDAEMKTRLNQNKRAERKAKAKRYEEFLKLQEEFKDGYEDKLKDYL